MVGAEADKHSFVDDFKLGDNLFIGAVQGVRGKSILAAQLLIELVSSKEVDEGAGLSGRWVQADNYIQALKDSFESSDGLLGEEYGTPYLIKNLQGVYDVLVLDGLGDERKTDFAAHEIGSLIRARYDRMKTTIITSRLSIGDIALRYGPRLADPMTEFKNEVLRGER